MVSNKSKTKERDLPSSDEYPDEFILKSASKSEKYHTGLCKYVVQSFRRRQEFGQHYNQKWLMPLTESSKQWHDLEECEHCKKL